jgi:alkanesulfonate monooxygenase SsuD/methylene tetrahydromethanopterin reductase-like flavin-dependent oxidoreductase (luciferase family)
MPRQIRLNAFDMHCVPHQSPGLWTHPRDRADRYNTLDYWIDLARVLEHGKFDALFLADVLGVYDEGQPVRSRGRHPGRSSIANATNGPSPARRQMSRPLRRRWRCASTRPRGA